MYLNNKKTLDETKYEEFLTEKEVSLRYKYSRSTLQHWRWKGLGPKFIKVKNRVLYPLSEVENFFNQFPLQQSTSETNHYKENN